MKRRIPLVGAALFFAGMILALGVYVPLLQAQEPDARSSAPTSAKVEIGKVIEVKGNALASMGDARPRILVVDAGIFLNEKLETGPKASIRIKFNDGTEYSQGESSAAILDEYVYNPDKPEECGFGMRFVKGACRVVSGVITEINPKRFKVKTRMATIGIRGCELGFNSTEVRDDIYVLAVTSKEKSVRINTTKDGTALNNMLTGQELPVEPAKKKVVDVTVGGRRVSVTQGKGVEEAGVTMEDATRIISDSSSYTPATYEMNATPDGAVLNIQPARGGTAASTPGQQ